MKTQFFNKAFSLLFGFFAIIIFISCNNGDESQPPKPIAPSVSAGTIEAGGSITFTDKSEGVKSRIWSFPGGNPSTSTAETVTVKFDSEGPVVCTLLNNFNDGSTFSQEVKIQVGTELIARYHGGFEGDTCLNIWSYWCPSAVDSANYEISIEKTQGANGSGRTLKIVVKNPGSEIQFFSVPKNGVVNDFSLNLDPSTAYTLSYWIKSADFIGWIDNANNNGTFAHNVVNKSDDDPVQSNRQLWKEYSYGNMAITTDWENVSQDFGPSDQYNGAITKNTYVWFKLQPTKKGILYIDEVSIKPRSDKK